MRDNREGKEIKMKHTFNKKIKKQKKFKVTISFEDHYEGYQKFNIILENTEIKYITLTNIIDALVNQTRFCRGNLYYFTVFSIQNMPDYHKSVLETMD